MKLKSRSNSNHSARPHASHAHSPGRETDELLPSLNNEECRPRDVQAKRAYSIVVSIGTSSYVLTKDTVPVDLQSV